MVTSSKLNLQPQGAYVDLPALQQLRYLAQPLTSSTRMANNNATSGQHHSRALSRGMEFEEVRLYQAGDDVRNIDWRVTARTQTTHTKCYRDEKEKPVITLVDQRRSLFFGSQHCFKSVYACHLAALINWSTLKRGDRVGGLVLDTHEIHETRPARSNKAVNRWLQMLSQSNLKIDITSNHQEPSLLSALKQLQRITRSGTECVLISDFYDLTTECEKILFQLSRHNTLKLYWVIDALEKHLPILSEVTISDGQQRTSLSINQKLQSGQQQQFIKKQEFLREISQRLSIQLIEVDTTQKLTDHLKLNNRRSL